MFQKKLSIIELISNSEKFTDEIQPRICDMFCDMLEWYSTRYHRSHIDGLSRLVSLGMKNFHTRHNLFGDYIETIGVLKYDFSNMFSDEYTANKISYAATGVKIKFIISQLWPHTRHGFRPRIMVTQTMSTTLERMKRLYGIDTCTLVKLYIAYAFEGSFEDLDVYEKIRDKIDREIKI